MINLSLHPELRPLVIQKCPIPKLIEVLRDSNIEDLDLSKVSAKALLNLTGETESWTLENVSQLNALLDNLGEELDDILEEGSEEEQAELLGLRQLVNALINNMPEPMLECTAKGCGRKFKKEKDLQEHVSRRHPENK